MPNEVKDDIFGGNERRKQLIDQLKRMDQYITSSNGDLSALDDSYSGSDASFVKTKKLLHNYLKENPSLATDYPELYGTSSTGQSIYTDRIKMLRAQQPSEATAPAKAAGADEYTVPNNIVPRNRITSPIKRLFGAKNEYSYNSYIKDGLGGRWGMKTADSPESAYNSIVNEPGRDLTRGNDLYEALKKRIAKKQK